MFFKKILRFFQASPRKTRYFKHFTALITIHGIRRIYIFNRNTTSCTANLQIVHTYFQTR